MFITGSNPLSTQDDVAAALVKAGLEVHAWYDCTPEEYENHIRHVLEPANPYGTASTEPRILSLPEKG